MSCLVAVELRSAPQVVAALINTAGEVDYRKVLPSPCPEGNDWERISFTAEALANMIVCAGNERDSPTQAAYFEKRVAELTARMSPEALEKAQIMVRNHKACGYYNDMDFALSRWGSPWNSMQSNVVLSEGYARFDAVNTCPHGVLEELSRKFPEAHLRVKYVSEEYGFDCGRFTLRAGEYLMREEAAKGSRVCEMTRRKWFDIACELRHGISKVLPPMEKIPELTESLAG